VNGIELLQSSDLVSICQTKDAALLGQTVSIRSNVGYGRRKIRLTVGRPVRAKPLLRKLTPMLDIWVLRADPAQPASAMLSIRTATRIRFETLPAQLRGAAAHHRQEVGGTKIGLIM
jgi:hypothetical protein